MHSTRVKQALSQLSDVDPAIAVLSLWCTYRDGDARTHTKDETIYVGPEFPLLPISEQTGLIAHHVLHVAFRHSARRGAAHDRFGSRFDASLFDLACDSLVNEALLQAGHALPRPAVRAAEIAALLPSEERPQNALTDWDSEKLYFVLLEQNKRTNASGETAIENYVVQQNFEPDLDGSEADSAEPEVWTGRVEQALQAGQRAGSGIGSILTRFGDLPQSKVPWEIRLRRMLNKALATYPSESHLRPSRSWLARDAYARQGNSPQPAFDPALRRSLNQLRIVIALDTSSSVTDSVLELFAAEAMSIVRRTGTEAHLITFDTDVHIQTKLRTSDDLKKIELRRGGGTDFAPMLSAAEALDPSIIVILTDLDAETPSFTTAPVIWAVPEGVNVSAKTGEILIIESR